MDAIQNYRYNKDWKKTHEDKGNQSGVNRNNNRVGKTDDDENDDENFQNTMVIVEAGPQQESNRGTMIEKDDQFNQNRKPNFKKSKKGSK